MRRNELAVLKPARALRVRGVCEMTGASRATVLRWAKDDPSFPRRFHLSVGVTVWDEHEVLAWINAKKAMR